MPINKFVAWKKLFVFGPTFLLVTNGFANTPAFELSLKSAEERAVKTSHKLKSAGADHDAAVNQASSQFAFLLPKLTFQGNYQYYAQIPQVQFTPQMAVPFGLNNVFTVGPTLTYTLWDTGSSLNAYRGASKLTEARKEDLKSSHLQLLLSTRLSYLQVELAVEELSLISDSLALASAQYKDVKNRFVEGAAANLDLVVAKRSVLNYQMQFQQRQAELSVYFKDLLAMIGDISPEGMSHPGPAQMEGVKLILKLDSFQDLLKAERDLKIMEPDENQPQIRGRFFEVESLRYQASSQEGKLWPAVQLTGAVTYNQPNMPTAVGASPLQYWQESLGASVSMPLYLGDPTWRQTAAFRAQVVSAEERLNQLRIDLKTNFEKSNELLESLFERRKLAESDLSQSEEIAKLYYDSYKTGKVNLIDVQNANLQSLEAKVNAARIDAQILTQIMQLKAISGKEIPSE